MPADSNQVLLMFRYVCPTLGGGLRAVASPGFFIVGPVALLSPYSPRESSPLSKMTWVGEGGSSYTECDKNLKDEWTGPQSTGKLTR